MTDEKYTFVSDIREKKAAARGVYAKKSGAKSHYCGLPSDTLTPAQLKRRNGPVISYNPSKPMSWDKFKQLPAKAQTDYLNGLISTYDVGATEIGEMMGTTRNAIYSYLKNHFAAGTIKLSRSHRIDPNNEAWKAFLAGDLVPVNQQEPSDEPEAPQSDTDLKEPVECSAEPPVCSQRHEVIQELLLRYRAVHKAELIASLMKLLPDTDFCRVTIQLNTADPDFHREDI